MNKVTIITTTYITDQKRSEVAQKAVASWVKHLKYDGELHLHIADDGSTFGEFAEGHPNPLQPIWPGQVTYSRQCRKGIGASLNAGLLQARDFSMYLVDDWALTADLFLLPWVNLLIHEPHIGAVRLGPPHPWLEGKIQNFRDGWAMVLAKHHYVYSGRPALYHRRYFDAYGLFLEGYSALECERLYNEGMCRRPGPDTVYALPYPWVHLGAEDGTQLSAIIPRGSP